MRKSTVQPARVVAGAVWVWLAIVSPGLARAGGTHPRIAVAPGDGAAACAAAKRAAGVALLSRETSLASANFDATYYHLNLTLDMDQGSLAGTVRAEGRVTGSSMHTLTLDLTSSMTVDAVTLPDSTALTFSHTGGALDITFPDTLAVGAIAAVDIRYHGIPPGAAFDGLVFGTRPDGKKFAWSLSEPYGAREWWPCRDLPSDKADSVRVTITVPSQYRVGSQGLLVSETSSGGNTTYDWSSHYPISTYLVSIAASEYVEYDRTYTRPPDLVLRYGPLALPLEHLVYNKADSLLPAGWDSVGDAMAVEEDWFGPYPFANEKYGHCEFTFPGGMENQTMSSLGTPDVAVVAHELAHHWFGDCISPKSWQDLWLNEGFASYAELLYYQQRENTYPGAYEQLLAGRYWAARFAGGTLLLQDTTDVNDMFDPTRVYSKGAMVLYMLRYVTGDTVFKHILQTYAATPSLQYANAATADFRQVAETVSGLDLGWFFHEWVTDGTGYPTYAATSVWKATGGGYHVWVTVGQRQDASQSNTAAFDMPMDIAVFTHGVGDSLVEIHREHVRDNQRTQVFEFDVASEPAAVGIDPDKRILRADSITTATEPLPEHPAIAELGPNPTAGALEFQYVLDEAGPVEIQVYDVRGRRVMTQQGGTLPQGVQFASLDTSHLAAGMYFLRVATGHGDAKTRFVVLH